MFRLSSCKGCEKPIRHPGCHATCEKYLNDKKLFEEEKAKMYAEVRKEQEARAAKRDGIARMRKSKHNRIPRK